MSGIAMLTRQCRVPDDHVAVEPGHGPQHPDRHADPGQQVMLVLVMPAANPRRCEDVDDDDDDDGRDDDDDALSSHLRHVFASPRSSIRVPVEASLAP
eukprot:1795165-Rhodomonas_salina.1